MVMISALLAILPVVASAYEQDHGLRTARKEKLTVSSAGKLATSSTGDAFVNHQSKSVVRRAATDEQQAVAPAPTPTPAPTPAPMAAAVATPAPTRHPTALINQSTQCVAWHNFSHYIALAFGDDASAAEVKFRNVTKACPSCPESSGKFFVVWFDTGTPNISGCYGSVLTNVFTYLCEACGINNLTCSETLAPESPQKCYETLSGAGGGGGRSSMLKDVAAQSIVATHPVDSEFVKPLPTAASPIMVKTAPSTAMAMEREPIVAAAREADRTQSTAAAYQIDSGFAKGENAAIAVRNADVKREPQMAKKEAVALTTPKADVEAETKSDGSVPAVKRESSAQGVSSSTCTDGHEACESWAQLGECGKNSGYMHVKCRASCNMCR